MRRLSWLGFGVAAALLVGAIAVVGAGWESLGHQWASAGGDWSTAGGRWPLVGAAVGLPLANWVLTSASFWVVTRRYGRIGVREMAALIGAASLLNYLPLRPGLIGRVAYHRAINDIPVWASAKVLIAVVACSGVSAGILLAATALAGPSAPWAVSTAAVVAPGVVLAGVWGMAWGKEWTWACYAGGAFFRYLDVLAWTGRYAATFALWGAPIGVGSAAVVAAVSQVVTLIPVAGNGLGLREWGTGYTAAWLAGAGLVVTAGVGAREVGLAADLTNRAAELVTLIPVGVLGWVWVARRLAAGKGESGNVYPTAPEQNGGAS